MVVGGRVAVVAIVFVEVVNDFSVNILIAIVVVVFIVGQNQRD